MRHQTFMSIALLVMLAAAMAGASYPNNTIRLIVPFGVGSDTDLHGRNLAEGIKRIWASPNIIVENLPGESGRVASMAVRAAPADGYTLMIGRVGTHAIQPALNPQNPYRWQDFTILGILELDPLICAVNSDSPYQTARELLAAIRQAPGKIKYSTAGIATMQSLAPQYMLHLAGLKPETAHGVHFDNGLDATRALLNKQVQFICNLPGSVIPHIKSGALRGLFTTAPGRMEALPQLQNAREAGLRDMGRMVGWSALIGPPGLPAQIVKRWQEALGKVNADPRWLAGNSVLGALPAATSIKDPEKFVREQFTLYDQLITSLEIRH